jgi:hypothetical protein
VVVHPPAEQDGVPHGHEGLHNPDAVRARVSMRGCGLVCA